jgi:hypothetical protein
MEIAVAGLRSAVMAEAQAEAKIATVVGLRSAVMDLQAKVVARAVMAPQVKVVAHAVKEVIAMVHADSLIVTAHVSRSVIGWKSHGMCKLSSSLKTNQPKL